MDESILDDRVNAMTKEELVQTLFDTLEDLYRTVDGEWGCSEPLVEWCMLFLDGER